MATQINLPKDAEGREIPLDTECLYTCDGEKQDVLSFRYYRRKDRWEIETDTYIVNSIYLYITPPDSWEKLEENLDKCISNNNDSCYYFSKSGACCDCTIDPSAIDCRCDSLVFKSIKERIRKLRSKE